MYKHASRKDGQVELCRQLYCEKVNQGKETNLKLWGGMLINDIWFDLKDGRKALLRVVEYLYVSAGETVWAVS